MTVVACRAEAASRAAVAPYVWATTRIALGAILLWAFVDKLFGASAT